MTFLLQQYHKKTNIVLEQKEFETLKEANTAYDAIKFVLDTVELPAAFGYRIVPSTTKYQVEQIGTSTGRVFDVIEFETKEEVNAAIKMWDFLLESASFDEEYEIKTTEVLIA